MRKPTRTTEQTISATKPIDVASMYEEWSPQKTYSVDEWVTYGTDAKGKPRFYQVAQAHEGQAAYAPDLTPALFNPVGFAEDGTVIWAQPFGAHDAYPLGQIVTHNGEKWKSTLANNVWAPGVYGWILYAPATEEPTDPGTIPSTVAAWEQPAGRHHAYPKGAFVTFGGKTWENTISDNVWEPGIYGWTERVIPPVVPEIPVTPPAPTIAAWKQPAGGHDAYALNAVVTYQGKTWKSTAANNVWAPGVYGWIVQV